ncbi:hypothetical protein [Massilia niabensis]|uniref:Uncharacterized protein n=1 Tax=Massilia niabensis TaxID=544910 RepID=A0ABW0L3I2_9BURK
MQSAIKPLIRTIVFYVLSVFMVAAVLVAGTFAYDAIRDVIVSRGDLETLRRVQVDVASYRERQAGNLAERLGGATQQPLAAVDRRIGALARELRTNPAQGDFDPYALLRTGPARYAERLASHYETALTRELAAQELAYLQQVRAHLVMIEGRAAAQRELERLHRVHIAIDQAYRQKQLQVAQLGYLDQRRMEIKLLRGPVLNQLLSDVAARRMDEQRAAAACNAQKAALDRMEVPKQLVPFSLDAPALDRAVQPLDALVDELESAVTMHPVSRISGLLLQALPVAAGLLLIALAGKFGLRAFLYFVLAPLVTRRPPVRLDSPVPGQRSGPPEAVSASAASQTIRLRPHEELLVLPRYLQGTPVAAAKTTRWLLHGRPWTSLVSGMVLLTCVRTRTGEEPVVLSAGDGGVGELALVRVPPASALVFQPRALVGLVCDQGAPLLVEQHWRLASLHAWLTLQLRYFVIRGPVILILQGRRGVRVRQADGGHLIRQTATLGFSSDVAYSTRRSAPFLPYLQGQTDLFYDRFEGDHGIYVHDETTDATGKGGRVKRGLEGLTDGVLKVFGL